MYKCATIPSPLSKIFLTTLICTIFPFMATVLTQKAGKKCMSPNTAFSIAN